MSYKVDTKWRKDVLKDVNIYVSDKKDNVNLDLPESLPKLEKEREWSDYGIQELLGKFIDGNKKLWVTFEFYLLTFIIISNIYIN